MRIRLRAARTAGFSILLLAQIAILAVHLNGSDAVLGRFCAGGATARFTAPIHLGFGALLVFGIAAFFLKRMRVVYAVVLMISLALLVHQNVLRCSLG